MGDSPRSVPAALLFDMDGTLTEPMLDFPRIKAEMGIGNQPILEALAQMGPVERRIAEAILLRHEEHAAENSTLNPGCHELIEGADRQRIRMALITRNSRVSVKTVLQRHRLCCFDVLVTREDGAFKPDPYPLRLACQKLNVGPSQAWMVGDGQYDVEAGSAAGIATVWISHGRPKSFAAEPWQAIRDLPALLELLQEVAADGPPGASSPHPNPGAA